ncbi:MAG: helix-turn-helix domain-containing protein [Bacteroidia bacterium]|nr:helix-turn-helix domain-containing protein [Bacteroidia bacterium]
MESIVLELLQKQGERLTNIESLLSQSKTVLNLDEVCTLTGLSKSHVYKRTMQGTIPHYKQAKHLFFDRVEVEIWLKENPIKTVSAIEQEAATYVTLNRKGGRK